MPVAELAAAVLAAVGKLAADGEPWAPFPLRPPAPLSSYGSLLQRRPPRPTWLASRGATSFLQRPAAARGAEHGHGVELHKDATEV